MKNKPRRDSTLAATDKIRAERRKALLKKFADGKKLCDADLIEIGLSGSATNHPNVVAGLEAIARIISSTFKIQCDRRYIYGWRKRPARPFPAPHSGNLFNVAQCLDWYREEIQATPDTGEHDLFQRAATERARGEIASEEHKEWERQVQRGAWIKKADHDRALAAAARMVQMLFDRREEVDGPKERAAKLRTMGATESFVLEFQTWDMAAGAAWVDGRRKLFQKHASAQ